MKNKKYPLITAILILLIAASSVFAQSSKEDEKNYVSAEELIDQQEFEKALSLYEGLLNKYPDNGNLNFKVGFCLYNIPGRKEEAVIFFENAMKNVSKKYKMTSYKDKEAPLETYYYMAEILQRNYKFEEAIKYLELILPYVTNEILESVKWKIQECKMGILLTKSPLNVDEINIEEVNSEYADYSPVVSGDENVMIFTSKRKGSTGGKEYKGEYYEDIYISVKENGRWTSPKKIEGEINTDQHESSIGLSFDGQELFIYRYDEEGKGEIYSSLYDGKMWHKPMKLSSKINSKYNEADATLSADGSTLYFTSDRPGGFGGYDIYKAVRDENGIWGNPVNLGPTINTVADERAPYIHPDGTTLFFSSNGHPSMGGLDVFYSTLENDQWTEPMNIGCPVNTPEDDICYIPSPDGKRAYYSSKKRDTKGNYDIYMLSYVEKEEEPIRLISGVVTNEDGNPIPNAVIKVTDLASNSVVYTTKPHPLTGKYLIAVTKNKNYFIEYKADGYLHHTEKLINDNNEKITVNKEISLSQVQQGKTQHKYNLVYNPENSISEKAFTKDMENIVNSMNKNSTIILNIPVVKGNPVSESRYHAIEKFLQSKNVDSKRISRTEIAAETDINEVALIDQVFYDQNKNNIPTVLNYVSTPKSFDIAFEGDTAQSKNNVEKQLAALSEYLNNNEYLVLVFNKTDSKEKIDFIVNSLLAKGVDKKRIIVNPHLESVYRSKSVKINITEPAKPLADASAKKTVVQEKTEPIVEKPVIQEKNIPVNQKPAEKNVSMENTVAQKNNTQNKNSVILKEADNKGKTYIINGDGQLVVQNNTEPVNNPTTTNEQKLANSGSFTLKSILFEYNQYYASGYESYLSEMASFLKKAGKVCIEISGNTDNKGTEEYNQTLGMKRANFIKDFLSKKGVNTSCFTVKSNGMQQPIARNTNPDGSDCPEGRKYNRRVDFKLMENISNIIVENLNVPDNLRIGASKPGDNFTLASLKGVKGISFRIQIAWVRNKVEPTFFNQKYGIDDKIEVMKVDGAYIYTVGNFTDYDAAKNFYNSFVNKVNGLCFIVPFLDGKKVSVQEALASQKATSDL